MIERIAARRSPRDPASTCVEIGPGHGALTRHLLAARGVTLDAIEIDRDLAARLQPQFADFPRCQLHQADVLEFDFNALARVRGGRLRLVGNLPYNISTPLLFHLLEQADALIDLHVMLQREVVARLAAAARQPRTTGASGHARRPCSTMERLFDVGPGAFQPPPRVWSAVVRAHRAPHAAALR